MYIVLDTNVILLDAYNLINIAKHSNPQPIVVLPETVLDEIDSKKSGHTEVAYQARLFARLLAKATRLHSVTDDIMNTPLLTTTALVLDGVTIHICALSSYPSFNESEQSIRNDRKILHVTELLNRRYPDLTFCSNDVMCRIRAESLGLKTSDYRTVETTDIEFTRLVEVSEAVFTQLHDTPIIDVVPDHKVENYNYIFETALSNQRKLATVSNGLIKVIGRATEDELRKQDIKPANSGQLFFAKALQDPTIDIVIAEAKAGSGKTACALSNGIYLVGKGEYDSILYIRSSIDDLENIESIGYLSGNSEKVEVYLHPLEDTIDFIARSRLKGSQHKGERLEEAVLEKIEDIKSRNHIKGIITLGLRGRTIRNTYVIVDEVGNLSKQGLQKVLTRFGEGCKIVLIGSNNQIDNPYLTKYTNGLSVLLEACKTTHDKVRLHAVNLPKVVRGPIAEFAENLYSKQA